MVGQLVVYWAVQMVDQSEVQLAVYSEARMEAQMVDRSEVQSAVYSVAQMVEQLVVYSVARMAG
tara:strand:+ start:1121 stop:1312 length:192 start_codon:yes stop_codon:yes gene_type:complete